MLLTYPMARPRIERVQRLIAAETGASLVDVRAAFERLTEPRAELFMLDGHCTALGNAKVAEVVAAALGQARKRVGVRPASSPPR